MTKRYVIQISPIYIILKKNKYILIYKNKNKNLHAWIASNFFLVDFSSPPHNDYLT